MRYVIESRMLSAAAAEPRPALTALLHVDAADDAGAISAFAAAHCGTVTSCEKPRRGTESIATMTTDRGTYLLRAWAE